MLWCLQSGKVAIWDEGVKDIQVKGVLLSHAQWDHRSSIGALVFVPCAT